MCLYHRLEKTPSSRPNKLGVFFDTICPCLAIYRLAEERHRPQSVR
nr:MAG TPA: hypothetical protein [Caudoviricetes sp.]